MTANKSKYENWYDSGNGESALKTNLPTIVFFSAIAGFAVLMSPSWGFEEIMIFPDPSSVNQQANLEPQKRHARLELMLQIDDLDRVCKLTDKQKGKLQVAIKGVVEKRFQKNAEKHEHGHDHVRINVNQWQQAADRIVVKKLRQAAIEPLIVAPAAEAVDREDGEHVEEDHEHEDVAGEEQPAEEQGEDEEAAAAEEDDHEEELEEGIAVEAPEAMPQVNIVEAANPFEDFRGQVVWNVENFVTHHVPVQDDPLWQQTIAHVLTPTQKKTYQKELQRRERVEQHAMMAVGVAQVTKRLGLTIEQQQKLQHLCETHLKNKGEAHSVSDLHNITATIDENLIKDFLSKAQRVVWSQLKKQRGQQFGVQPVFHQLDGFPADLDVQFVPADNDG